MSTTRTLNSAAFDELWADAVRRNGLGPSSFKGDASGCRTFEDVIAVLEKDKYAMKIFRKKGQKIRDFMKPFASLVGVLADTGGSVADAAGVPGGNAVFSVFSVLLTATKGVSEAYDALEKLLDKLQSFLRRLDTYLASPVAISPALKDILVKILAQLLDVLALCAKHFDQNVHRWQKVVLKRAEDYVQALFGDTKVKDMLEKLDELTSEEQLGLIVETFVTANTIMSDVTKLREEQAIAMQKLHEELVTIGISKWLSPPNLEDPHSLASRARQDETGEWFFGAQFATWRESKNGVFWIHGKPGSGKSVLFSSIVDKLKQQDTVVYFYFDSKQTVRGLIASIVHQLASQSTTCLELLKKLHADCSRSLIPPSKEKLLECLETMLQALGKVYILIDALDECSEVGRHKDLFPLIKQIVALDHEELRLLATSRPEADIQECMMFMATEQLSLHDISDQASALARHVARSLADTEVYRGWSDELRSQAQDVLTSKSGGMFLWADLQLDRLRHCHPSAVEDALKTLPVTLYDTYERILAGIVPDNALLAHRVFECIAFAARPLTPEELAEVLIMKIDTEGVLLKPEHRTTEPELWLLRTCSSMVQISNGGSSGEDKRLVQFVHLSAQEYLSSVQLPDRLSVYRLLPASSHTTLARLCLSVLNSSSPFHEQPFADYAICHWMIHVKLDVVQAAVEGLLTELFHPYRDSFSRFIEGWTTRTNSTFTWAYPYDENSTPLYIAAHLGLSTHVNALLDTYGVKIDTPHAPALWAAAVAGHINVVRSLLERGADVDACQRDNSTPLYVAAECGHLNIVRLLLDHGATTSAYMADDATPLHIAAQYGHVEVASLLLERGAVLDARLQDKSTPLYLAVGHGQLDVVRLLLERGAAVDACMANDWTPLHLAASQGHFGVARLLLEHAAAIDADGQGGLTPLHAAAEYGHVDVARLLIEHGATVHNRRQDNSTPLHIAAEGGHVDVARLLLKRGAAVDAYTADDWTPLHLAARNGHLDVARLLIQDGASVNARGDDGGRGTPLYWSAYGGHADMVLLLLEHAATVDAHKQDGSTPLYTAAEYGRDDVVRLLLERGAAVDAGTKEAWTSLHIAANFGHINVTRLLLEHGANPNARRSNGGTALHIAAQFGYVDVALLLLERAAAVDAREKEDITPLYYAAAYGHASTVRLLLERGAAVNVRVQGGWTPLTVAVKFGHFDAVCVLLEHGATVNICQQNNVTPLHVAAEFGLTDIARLLLEHGASVDARQSAGLTPLHKAVNGGHAEVARLLLEHGATVDESVRSLGDVWTAIEGAEGSKESEVEIEVASGEESGWETEEESDEGGRATGNDLK